MATLRMKMRPRKVTRISSSRQLDEPVVDERLQPRQFGREVLVEVDAELARDFALANHRVAEQPRDQGAAQAIVAAQAVAAHGGDAAAVRRPRCSAAPRGSSARRCPRRALMALTPMP